MPKKIASFRSYGEKLISLFARLLFSGERHSLTGLSRMLGCSKQTVLRLVEDIRRAYGVDIEESVVERQKYYRLITRGGTPPELPLSDADIHLLTMCRAFTRHLLGENLFQETAQALERAGTGRAAATTLGTAHFSAYLPGTIDYTDHHDHIRTLIQAMEEKRICRVVYRKIMADAPKTYSIKPFKLFSHRETIYLHARMAREPGTKYKAPEYDPLLAVHRIERVAMTERSYAIPAGYDFEKAFNRHFGIVKEETFRVTVRFTGWAARYVAERQWSPDQRIVRSRDGSLKLVFSAASEIEVVSWVMPFGAEARVESPKWLAQEIKTAAGRIAAQY